MLTNLPVEKNGPVLQSTGTSNMKSSPFDRDTLMSLLDISHHPLLTEYALRCARRMGVRDSGKLLRLQWWTSWIGHPSLLAVLAMGVVGFLSVEIQIAAIHSAVSQARDSVSGSSSASAQHFQDAINSQLRDMSGDYATKSNTAVTAAQNEINDGLLGWVNMTTSTINSTLNEFTDGIAEVLNSTFANTPLFTPIQSFVGCILVNKILDVEKGLTWIQSHAHVTLPTVPPDTLLLNPSQTQALVQPAQEHIVGNKVSDTGVVSRLADTYLHGLERQGTLFLLLVVAYLVLALVGAAIAIFHPWIQKRGLRVERRRKKDSLAWPQATIQGGPRDFEQTTERNTHHSISKPMLPDVLSSYYQEQERREKALQAAAFDGVVRAKANRAYHGRSAPQVAQTMPEDPRGEACAPLSSTHHPQNPTIHVDSSEQEWMLAHTQAHESLLTMTAAPSRRSQCSVQAPPSSRLSSCSSSMHASRLGMRPGSTQHFPDRDMFADSARARKESTDHGGMVVFDARSAQRPTTEVNGTPRATFGSGMSGDNPFSVPDDVHLTRQFPQQSPASQHGHAF